MGADASQQSLSLGWFLLLAVPGVIACVWVWLASGAETADRALADLPTDDEPAVCTDPACGCEEARFRYRLRAVARADAEAVQR